MNENAGDERAAERGIPVKIALFTGVFRNDPLKTVAEAAASTGYDGLELRALSHLPPDSSAEQVREVGRIVRDYGLDIAAIYTGIDGAYANASDSDARDTLDRIKRYGEWAAQLGAGIVCYAPGGPVPEAAKEEDIRRAAFRLAQAADELARTNVRLAMEIHFGGLLETIDSSLQLIDCIQHPNAGLILDPGNMAIVGEEYGAAAVGRLGRHIFHVHAKDIRLHAQMPQDRAGGVYKQTAYTVELMGNGHVDHGPALQALLGCGYSEYISLEAQVAGVVPRDIAAHEYAAVTKIIEDAQIIV